MKISSTLKNPSNFYFMLWMLYYLQGTLYQSGSLISQFILLIILAISFRHVFFLTFSKKQTLFFKGLDLLFLMFSIYGIILLFTSNMVKNSSSSYIYLKEFLVSLLPIYSCYYYTLKGYLKKNNFMFWIIFFFIVIIAQYYRNEKEVLERILNREVEGITNNVAYLFLSLIPCLFVFKKKTLLSFVGLGICAIYLLMAMKRGAIIIGVIVILQYFWFF